MKERKTMTKEERKIDQRIRYLFKKYGITLEQYNEILQKQDGKCLICKFPAKFFKRCLAVDHDHRTGVIRGLLCNRCNRQLGWFESCEDAIKEYLYKNRILYNI